MYVCVCVCVFLPVIGHKMVADGLLGLGSSVTVFLMNRECNLSGLLQDFPFLCVFKLSVMCFGFKFTHGKSFQMCIDL